MNSKDKGNIGEAIILSEFISRGIQVSIPFGDNARYDLIAEFNGKLNKIQVKYCNQNIINGSICCPCVSSKNHTTNKSKDTYENDVDYFAYFLAEWNEAILIPISELIGKKTIRFRKEPSLNNQNIGMHFIQNYSFDKILCVETLHDEPKE